MIIPRTISKVVSHSDNESSRYALGGVQLERDADGKCHAICTDGRRLIHSSWVEPESPDSCAVAAQCDLTPADSFSAIVDAKQFKQAATLAKPSGTKRTDSQELRAVDYMALDETSCNGSNASATFHGANLKSAASSTEQVVEGKFPKWRDVLPVVDDNWVTVTLDWKYLKEACEALGTISSNDMSRGIDFHIRNEDSAVLMSKTGADSFGCESTTECVIMPMASDRKKRETATNAELAAQVNELKDELESLKETLAERESAMMKISAERTEAHKEKELMRKRHSELTSRLAVADNVSNHSTSLAS